MPDGIIQSDWDAAKSEARNRMIARAKLRGMIPYADLVRGIAPARFDAHDQPLFHLLKEISAEEDAVGRGMLSVVVVHKSGDWPDTANILVCWVNELKRVYATWST